MPSVQVIPRRPDTRRQALGQAIAQAGNIFSSGMVGAAQAQESDRRYEETRADRQSQQQWRELQDIFRMYPDDPDMARAAALTRFGADGYEQMRPMIDSYTAQMGQRGGGDEYAQDYEHFLRWEKAWWAAKPEERRGLETAGRMRYADHPDPRIQSGFYAAANPDVDMGEDAREAAIGESQRRFQEDMQRRGEIREATHDLDDRGARTGTRTTVTPASMSPAAAQATINNLAQQLSRGDMELAIDIADRLYGDYDGRAPSGWQRPDRTQIRAQYQQQSLHRAGGEPGGLAPAVQEAMGERMPNPMMEAMATSPQDRVRQALAPGMVQGPEPPAEAALQQAISAPPSPGQMVEQALQPGLQPPPGPLPPQAQQPPSPGPQVLGQALAGGPGPQQMPPQQAMPPQPPVESDVGTVPPWATKLHQDQRLPKRVWDAIELKRRQGMPWPEILELIHQTMPQVYALIEAQIPPVDYGEPLPMFQQRPPRQ